MIETLLDNFQMLYDVFFKIFKERESRRGGNMMIDEHRNTSQD
jgi:hypothetical protein